MNKSEYCLTPIIKQIPAPPHTKIHVRCFTCRKFPVCNIRQDYLKTAQLIENIIGNPCENLELKCYPPCFTGTSIIVGNQYLPSTITTTGDNKGTYEALKMEDFNTFNFIYKINNYLIMFTAEYVNEIRSFGDNVSDEDFFNALSVDDFTFPAQTSNAPGTQFFYHYKPTECSLTLSDIEAAKAVINSVDEGSFSVNLGVYFRGVFGNFNDEGRYPTEAEIEADPTLVQGLTSGYLKIPLKKEKDVLSLDGQVSLNMYSTGDTAMYFNVFGTSRTVLSEATSKNIFEVLNPITTDGYFTIKTGKDIFYDITAEISDSDKSLISAGLVKLRKKLIDNDDKTLINTTAFSVDLQCQFYEWERGLTEEEGLKRIMCDYPNGVPIGDEEYYHLETIHMEPGKVPCYHPANGSPVFMPMPYPVFVPPKCEKHYPTRDELNEV